MTHVAFAFVTVVALGCTGGTVTVFNAKGQMSPQEQREWFAYQRDSRASYDPQIRSCLAAPAPALPDPPTQEFAQRAHRTLQSAPRALVECKQDVGASTLEGKLSLAVSYSPEGNVLAARVIDERTHTGNPAFNDCVRRRFCFLKGWPGEAASNGEIFFNTEYLP